MNLDVDVIIVVGFLLIILVAGLLSGRGIKTVKDYALGGKNFSTGTLVAAITATWIDGGFFSIAVSETYTVGIWYVITGLGDAISLLIIGYIFVPRMKKFMKNISVAEVMGNLYGKHIAIITSVSSIALSIGMSALQIKIFSTIFDHFLGISSIYAIFISSAIVILYSAFGGIKSVTFTDIIQFFTFGVFIPIFAIFVWNVFGSKELIVDTFTHNPLFDYKQIISPSHPKFWPYLFLLFYCSIPSFSPTMFQRTLMAKNVKQAKSAFAIAALLCLFIYLFDCFIGLVVLSHDPNLNPQNVAMYVVEEYSFVGLRGLALIGVMSMIMSTADSWINTGSVIFTNDFCKSLGIRFTSELTYTRIFAACIGVCAVFLAMTEGSLLDLMLFTANFYMPIVTVPLVLAILGFHTTPRVVLTGIIFAIFTIIIWRYTVQPLVGVDSVIPGMFANLIALLTSHYLLAEPGGWIGNKEELKQDKDTQFSKKQISNFFLNLPANIQKFNLLEYCNGYLPKDNAIYNYFSFAVFLTIITTMSIERELYNHHLYLINIFQAFVLTIATSFLCNTLWPKAFKEKYLGIIWYLSVFVTLALISSFLVLLSKFSHVSLTILTIHLTMIPLLLGWRTALMMIIAGLWVSFFLYQTYISEMVSGEIYDLKLKLVYVLFIVGGFALTLLRSKQEHLEATEEKAEHLEYEVKGLEREVGHARGELENVVQGLEFLENQFQDKEGKLKSKEIYLKDQLKLRNIEISKLKDLKDEFIRNIPHETNTPMTGILSLSEVLYSCYDSLDEKIVKQSIKDIVSSSDRLKSFVSNIADLSKLSALTYELNKTKVDLSELARERPVLYKKIFADDDKQDFIFKVEDNIIVRCDEYYITQAIDNLISNAVKYGEGKPITISLTKLADNKIEFKIADEGIGIPKGELISIFHKFTTSSKTQTPAGGRGVGLALCEKVITVHGGRVEATSDGKKGSEFSFVLPL